MTAHDLYTRTLSDYKSCLCSSPALTLRSYCRERHVNYHGMCLWLSRHGISIRELRPSSSVTTAKEPASSFSRRHKLLHCCGTFTRNCRSCMLLQQGLFWKICWTNTSRCL